MIEDFHEEWLLGLEVCLAQCQLSLSDFSQEHVSNLALTRMTPEKACSILLSGVDLDFLDGMNALGVDYIPVKKTRSEAIPKSTSATEATQLLLQTLKSMPETAAKKLILKLETLLLNEESGPDT